MTSNILHRCQLTLNILWIVYFTTFCGKSFLILVCSPVSWYKLHIISWCCKAGSSPLVRNLFSCWYRKWPNARVKFMASSLRQCECAEINCKDPAHGSSHLQLRGVNNGTGVRRGQGGRLAVCWERAWASLAHFCRWQAAAGIGWSMVMLRFGGEGIFQRHVAAQHLKTWPSSWGFTGQDNPSYVARGEFCP